MVRVPGSLEDAQAEFGQGNQASTENGSPSTLLIDDGSADRQSLGRGSTDGTEEGLDANRGLPDESPPAQAGIQPPSARSFKKKPARSKSSRKKMKAPDSDADDRFDLALTVTEAQLAAAYYRKELHAFLLQDGVMKLLRPKLLGDLAGPVSQPTSGPDKLAAVQTLLRLFKEVGIIAGALDAQSLFDLKLSEIQNSTQTLFQLLKPLIVPGAFQIDSIQTSANAQPRRPNGDIVPIRICDRRGRAERAEHEVAAPVREPKIAAASVHHSPEKLDSFFHAAMERFRKEQQLPGTARKLQPTGDQDVDMESVGSPIRHSASWEFDPDDLDLGRPARAVIATTASTSAGGTGAAPRIRVSAMSELKEFSGKDGDEDRSRSWVKKVRSAFVCNQAPDDEKCLVFGDLLTGPSRNWYRQLSGTTRTTWKDLLQSFQIQYCGRCVSVARQYYHARKRSDESPLEYLHRLNVAGLRTRLQVKDGPPDVRREHVEHFIETLDDRDLADQLALLRIPDADILEEVCDLASAPKRDRARQCMARSSPVRSHQLPPVTAQCERSRYRATLVTPTLDQVDRVKMEICAECTRPRLATATERLNIAPLVKTGVYRNKIATVRIVGPVNTRCQTTWGRPSSGALIVGLSSMMIWDVGSG
ncbi:hypothetical protein PHYSODRAFT_330603 [Phytophthora sojae]|uniref:Retrotransposon gag domain-containing protein n=1 Tax=Phytophthora sojae (strain P6497) TaxID=1094619 RepID=G4ZEL7_PHYSP|nr:hypothetical protein PHYSODRAFT_330603 [Phytophthora sojae]EGZ16540.1 hypothetical protein PHYSODRAFT_330603 [Phytophthora sojae]|eukprot:XP_009525598.1 hypothetical protein PHYSODRAFT_330603 [Phytophthora sojae]